MGFYFFACIFYYMCSFVLMLQLLEFDVFVCLLVGGCSYALVVAVAVDVVDLDLVASLQMQILLLNRCHRLMLVQRSC